MSHANTQTEIDVLESEDSDWWYFEEQMALADWYMAEMEKRNALRQELINDQSGNMG